MNSIIKSYINEAFELSDMSDVDYTDTFADMDDEVGLIKEWCDRHIKFAKVDDNNKERMTTYSGRYEIDPNTNMIDLLFTASEVTNPNWYIPTSRFRNGRQVQIVDDVTGNTSNWTGGDFPDYIKFNKCEGDFIVTNGDISKRRAMTFCGFPVTIDGDLFVRLGLQQVSYGRWDTPDSQNGFVGLPLVIDLTKMPTKTCTGISMTDCGLTSLKGMPKIKSDAGHDSNIDFSHNRLRSLDGINLSGDAKIKRFTIDNNVIETLAGSPQEVYDTCDVSDNNLRTLIGMPRYIGGDFMCYNNFLKKSTVISRLSDVQGKKCGLNCQRPDPNKAVKMKTKVNEGFTFSDMSDVDYTDTFADMDDKLIIIKEWCDKHLKFDRVADGDAERMTTYSGRYEIDQSSYVINIRFDRHSASNYGRYIFGRAESYRNGRRVQVVDDVADPKSGESNRWTGGDFPDYIQFNECDGDFVVTNYKWYACPPMTFTGFPVTVSGNLIVNIGLKNSKRFNDNQTVTDGWRTLSDNLDLSNLPTKTCNGISFTNCGLSSIKGMPALKPVLYNTCDIDFGDNKLRNLDGINLTGNPQIGMFVISDNAIETLAGSPKRVSGRCDVSNNNLTTLIGMPGYIGGDFNCYNNFLKRSTVISKLSIVGGKKWGLQQQKKNPAVPSTKKRMNEDFDFSDMSSVDYTDTFADTDDNAVNERMTDIKKWVTYNIFGIDWNTSNERTRDFIDNVVMVTVETDGYHMSIVLPEDDFTDELSLWQVTMNLFKSVQFGNNGISYAMPAGSTTGMYPGLKLDRFVCDGFTDGEITIRVDTNNFKWPDLTPCFKELDFVRQLEIGSWSSDKKLKIDSLDGFPKIKGVDDFTFRLGSVKYKKYSEPVPFPVFFDDVVKNIKLSDVHRDAPSTVRIMLNYGMLTNPSSETDSYGGVFDQNYNNYLCWNGAPNYIRYMTWDAFRRYVREYVKPETSAAMEHLIDGWKKKSDIGGVFTVNDNNSFHTDTPWTTCVANVGGIYYVMDPKILERMTDGQWKRLSPLV